MPYIQIKKRKEGRKKERRKKKRRKQKRERGKEIMKKRKIVMN